MKIEISQESLTKALSIVGRSVASKPSLPVLANILLATENSQLKLSATNLQMGINFWLPAKIVTEGSVTVPARVLTEFVSSLPKQTVELFLKDQILHLSCGSFEANINGITASEFPSLPKADGEPTLKIPAVAFAKALAGVCFAAAPDEGRPVLTGVLTNMREKEILLVATDGYRLSKKLVKTVKRTEIFKQKAKLIIPARTLLEVSRIVTETVSEEDEDLRVVIVKEQNQIVFVLDKVEVSSRLVEGSFPDFTKVIPTEFKTKVEVETEELNHAVRVASIFARDSANIIRILLDPKIGMTLSANTKEVGDNVSRVEAKVTGEKMESAFNSRYVLDFLTNVDSEMLCLEFSGSLSPGVFRPLLEKGVDETFLHLIMPVRVQG